jgi:hypothetical protein
MSSWDRARSIPWSKIPQNGTDLSDKKERIFRDLQREADQQEKQRIQNSSQATSQASSEQQIDAYKVPFRWGELFKNAAFGGCIGSITGSVFGFMDGMKTAGTSHVLQNASNMAKGKYILQGTTRSATIFGVFFGGFHVVKYGLRLSLDPGEFGEIGLAGIASLGALMIKPTFRPSMPYASMLIVMDGAHIIMREFDSS